LFEKLDSGVARRPLSGQQLPAADEQYVDFYDHAPDLGTFAFAAAAVLYRDINALFKV
jgi:hypothetical protein